MALTEWTKSMEWLAAASEDPGACKQEWQNGSTGVALLAAGRFWDVLIVPEDFAGLAAGFQSTEDVRSLDLADRHTPEHGERVAFESRPLVARVRLESSDPRIVEASNASALEPLRN